MTPEDEMVTVIFGSTSSSETQWETFTPSPRIVKRKSEINKLQAVTFNEEGASEAENIVAPQTTKMRIVKSKFLGQKTCCQKSFHFLGQKNDTWGIV